MASDSVPVGITKAIAQDYARRGAFKEIRPDQPSFWRKFSTSERYRVGYKLAFKILDDAYEQSLVGRGRHGVGVNLAYASLSRHLRGHLKWAMDFDPAEIFYFVSGPEPDFTDGKVLEGVFHRLGIPLVDAKQRAGE